MNSLCDLTFAKASASENKFLKSVGCGISDFELETHSLTNAPISHGTRSSCKKYGEVEIHNPAVVLDEEWRMTFPRRSYAVAAFTFAKVFMPGPIKP